MTGGESQAYVLAGVEWETFRATYRRLERDDQGAADGVAAQVARAVAAVLAAAQCPDVPDIRARQVARSQRAHTLRARAKGMSDRHAAGHSAGHSDTPNGGGGGLWTRSRSSS